MISDDHDVGVDSSSINEKAINLFKYLREVNELRVSSVSDVSQYEEVFWFSDIPREKLCRCAAWGIEEISDESDEESSDIWIEVHKPTFKPCPKVSDELKRWIKEDEIKNSSLERPGIFSEIPITVIDESAEMADEPVTAIDEDETGVNEDESIPTHTEILKLYDFPEISALWEDYIESKWKPWAEEDRRFQRVQKAYNKLFAIYQEQEKRGERYEIVVGVGLLSWKAPNSGLIRRHVICLQARAEFDRHRGIMIVRAELDGPMPALECEMLDTSDRPEINGMNAIRASLREMSGDHWKGPELESALRMFGNEISTRSRYENTLEHATKCEAEPKISLSPAVILRHRSRRSFTDFYSKMIERIQSDGEVPNNILRLLEVPEEDDDGQIGIDDSVSRYTSNDIELYFPLPSNREQRRIVEQVNRQKGVLVQGPPGTGKSHTIANLVTHFLATGKKVLVTSQTGNALAVLQDMLPQEIRELCVTWFGTRDSYDFLERSVQGITDKKNVWDVEANQKFIKELEESLHQLRCEQQKLAQNLRSYREKETYRHEDIFGYSGRLQQIAAQISEERQDYGWLLDRSTSDSDSLPTVTKDELLSLSTLCRSLTEEDVHSVNKDQVPLNQIIEPHQFQKLVEDERAASEQHDMAKEGRLYSGYNALRTLNGDIRRNLLRLLKQQMSYFDSGYYQSFSEKIAKEITGGHDEVWRNLLQFSEKHIEKFTDSSDEISTLQVAGIDDGDNARIAAYAQALKDYLDEKETSVFLLFPALQALKERILMRKVRVNGRACDNSDTLGLLLEWFGLKRTLQDLHERWCKYFELPTGAYAEQLATYRNFCKPLKDTLATHDYVKDVKKKLGRFPEARNLRWHEFKEASVLCVAIESVETEERRQKIEQVFAKLMGIVRGYEQHAGFCSTTASLLHAIENRDIEAYSETFSLIKKIHNIQDVLSRFERCAPLTCEAYKRSILDGSNESDEDWEKRFQAFEKAWPWAKADAWLTDMCDVETPRRLTRRLQDAQQSERNKLKSLAAHKAWRYCMENLGERRRQALVAWKMAVQKIGLGKGRYVEQYREEARNKLRECRPAIPAWIMPLHQVVETIDPAPRIFDVVIVDEASQSGADSLFVNYIGKKLIVVGDDKQITPYNIGINHEQVDYLRRLHLKDIPHNESFGLQTSLFAQAKLRFSSSIRLREHFRCMPEIIQFSNKLSYQTEPLIPLRQYGQQRLQPVKTTYVKGGYCKGSSSNAENLEEARAIVSQIVECCKDPAYNHADGTSKTFGVINLLGHRQSDIINKLLVEELGAEEMTRRKLICGEPYDFQGDERDIIFISMVVDALQDGEPRPKVRDAKTQRRFNVAASRARDQLWLFHSVTLNDLKQECLRYKLLEYCQTPKIDDVPETIKIAELQCKVEDSDERMRGAPSPFDSWFEVDVYLRIVARGYRVLPQHKIAGYQIDLVVEGFRGRMAVECDGDRWHGPERYDADMERQRNLERCGWIFFRILGSTFYRDPDEALEPLWKSLDEQEILPHSDWEAPETSQDAGESLTNQGSLDWYYSHQQKEVSSETIQGAVVAVLRNRPKRTCTSESITGRVLKYLSIRTRGNPRAEFVKCAMRNVDMMIQKGFIEEYQAKNKRLRLLVSGDSAFP